MLLSPGEEARVGTRQMLSRMVANYLMIGVLAQGGQLADLARLPAYSLQWGLAAGLTDSLVVGAAIGCPKIHNNKARVAACGKICVFVFRMPP